MSAVVVLHVSAAVALVGLSIMGVARASARAGRIATRVAGVVAVVVVATGFVRIRAWEAGYRRAIYLASRSAGLWLDRKLHVGLAACAFALAAALLTSTSSESVRARRWAGALAAACALAALALVTFVHARVPSGAIEIP